MTVSFRVYVDESGDEGFTFHPDGSGSSRWLVLSAVVTRTENDLETVKLVSRVREKLGKPVRAPLHFRDLKHEQRVPYVREISGARLRSISVLVCKQVLNEPETFQAEKFRLYRYAARYLLERVSWLCRDTHVTGRGDGSAEVIFSNRSHMSYENLRAYLYHLRDNCDTRIHWASINPDSVRAVNHEKLMGLQIADAVASSLFYAVNVNRYGEIEDRYARLLAPSFYRYRGTLVGYGLKFWPESLEKIRTANPHVAVFAAF